MTNIPINYLDIDEDGEETRQERNEEEPTTDYMGSSMIQHNSLHNYDNNQSHDIQARGSKRTRYNNVDKNE